MRFLLFFLLFTTYSFGQIGMGQWRLHVPALKALDVVAKNDRIFTAFENGVSEYDISSKEITIWDAVNYLSDISVKCLGNSTSDNAVFIGYKNGNIDKIKNNTVTNIPAIKLAQVQGSKEIFKIVEYQNHMYVATGFSIVKIDPVKNEVRDTYYPTNGNQAILDVAFRNDSIYALTANKLYRGALSNPALADPAQWLIDARLPILGANMYKDIEAIGNELFVLFKQDGYGLDSVYQITTSGIVSAINEPFTMEINSLNTVRNKLAVNFYTGSIIYNADFSQFENINQYTFGGTLNIQAMGYANNEYWFADDSYGLVAFKDNWNNNRISFVGPPKNEFYSMDWLNGRLVVAGGGLNQAAQTFSHSGIYIFENESWSLRDGSNMSLWTGSNVWDFLSVSINPNDKDNIAVSTYSWIPLSIMDKSGAVTDTLTPFNSNLANTFLGNGSSLVSDIKYDNLGNLWVLNGYTINPLKVYTKDKEWYNLSVGSTASNKVTKKLVIDYNGNKWFSVSGVGLYGYNDNGTISSSNDDKTVLLNVGELTGALPSNEVTAIAYDFDNEIWIGTDNGFAILYNSTAAFDAVPGDYNARRIKLEFEGNVEYMLGNTYITDIEVDGGNRKWIATANAGILLLSPDGLEILEQHTTANSPLISNNILDLEIDHKTGELFIITDLGLVSYRSNATYEDPEYSDVTIFPNPARPDFNGPISIQGIRYNSDVKITDAAGNLVYKTTSNGGTATWDGKTTQGDPVKTGVYLIWTAANEGKGKFVGKVLVVN